MSGILNNFTGYMLGNGNHLGQPGQPWWPYDTSVFVCLDIDKARNVLEQSWLDANSVIWTTIYRVTAPSISYDCINNNMLWTHDASKLIVDGPVYHRSIPNISEAVLLNRARLMRPAFARFIRGRGK